LRNKRLFGASNRHKLFSPLLSTLILEGFFTSIVREIERGREREGEGEGEGERKDNKEKCERMALRDIERRGKNMDRKREKHSYKEERELGGMKNERIRMR
jgi:hypothetical protein